MKLGINFSRGQKLIGYCDADFAGDRESRKSTSGYLFTLAGGAISWRSKLQTGTAQCTLESEYTALSHAIRELLWLRILMVDILGKGIFVPTVLYCDNQGAISFCKHGAVSDNTEHIDVKYHFIREHVQKKTVALRYIPTNEMVADVLTKCLCNQKHVPCRSRLGMSHIN